jgi:hypothetical protein
MVVGSLRVLPEQVRPMNVNLRRARIVSALAAGLAAGVLSGLDAGAQGSRPAGPERTCPMLSDFAAFHRCALEKMKAFKPPRTSDGKPDMNGMWSDTRIAQDIEEFKAGQYGPTGGNSVTKSLIVEPVDGKIPYQPWAQERRRKAVEEFVSPTALCLPVSVQRFVYSPTAGAGMRIIQQPDYFVWTMERLHTHRIIPLTPRPRLAPDIKMWMGASQGRWEGNTLVIETTNLNDLGWFDHIGTFMTDSAKLEERLTMVDINTIHYEERIEDPRVFTQPWKIAKAMTRITAKGMALRDLEDTSVENCDLELEHFFRIGQKPYPGFHAVRPK